MHWEASTTFDWTHQHSWYNSHQDARTCGTARKSEGRAIGHPCAAGHYCAGYGPNRMDQLNGGSPETKWKATRICLDPKNLKQAIKQEHYPLPTIEDISTCTRLQVGKSCSIGHITSDKGLQADPAKVRTIIQMPALTDHAVLSTTAVMHGSVSQQASTTHVRYEKASMRPDTE